MGICIFGSLNMDLMVQAPRLPRPGETLSGTKFETIPGGKGANQAVAAARLGAQAHLFGRVGADGFGQQLLSSLQSQGVVCDDIAIDESTHTGIATIIVAGNGENQIVLAAGANGQVGQAALQDGSYPLMQRVFVIIREDGTLEELGGIAYANLLLTQKGQSLIDQAGYLPMRSK